jgi:hypothetical protein
MLREALRAIREFSLELTIAALLIFNLSLAMLSAKKKGSFAKLKLRLIYGPMTAFPLLIVATYLLVPGFAYDADRSSFTLRTLPIHGLFFGSICCSVWLVFISKSARWFVISLCLIYLLVSLYCWAFAILWISNNVFI